MTTDLTAQEIEDLKRLETAATKGDWRAFTSVTSNDYNSIETLDTELRESCDEIVLPQSSAKQDDVLFIVAARNALPRLLEMVEWLQQWHQERGQMFDDVLSELATLRTQIAERDAALRALVDARALKGVRGMVAGWNGEGKPQSYSERHPDRLGATLPKTNCGAVYALDEAMQAARAILEPNP